VRATSCSWLVTTLVAVALLLGFVAASQAREKTVRDQIIRLEKEYRYLDEELTKLREKISGFPDTVLDLSVVQEATGVRLISIELTDNERLLKSHIYTRAENAAISGGGRQSFFRGEVRGGLHNLRLVYYWSAGGGAPVRGEASTTINVENARRHFVEFNLVRGRRGVVLMPRNFGVGGR
jgi:hypothetical protein